MADTQPEAPMGENSSRTQTDQPRSTEAPAMSVARLLANLRRIRRA